MFPGNGAGSSGTQSSSTGTKKRRLSNLSISPSVTAKNRYSPLLIANDNSDMDLASSSEGEDNQQDKVSQKIPPIYAYNITDFDNFHKSLSEITTDEFTINHTKNALKLNLSSIDDYRSITKKFDDTEIQYHTYQFPLDKQLSLIIRNLPVSISEKSIFEALSDLDYKEPLAELDSDHNPVKININSPLQFYQPNNSLIKGKPNWNIYSDYINNNLKIPKNIPTNQLAEELAEHFTDIITDAARVCSTTASSNSYSHCALPQSILSLIQQKHTARRTWQNHRNSIDKKILNKLTKEVQSALQLYRVNSYKQFLSNIHHSDSTLWKVTNRLLNQETNIIPPLRTSSRLVKSDEEKCKVFSENLRNTFSLNQIANNSNDLRIEQILKTPNYSVQNSLNYVTPNEIKSIIKRLPAKKSPGHDRITNLLLKKLPNKAILYTTSLFNALLRLGCFPVNWKKAIVILIKKPGKDNTNPDSYRPISLLTSLSKVFEKVIHTRLLAHLDYSETIPKFQFGFRSHHSTTQQLLRLTEHISNSFEKHCHAGAVFIDISKAFDKVWHQGLLYKLKIINTPNYIFNIISEFLSNRQFSVKINDNFSDFAPITAGVPQGSILGPTLFNVYISDIPQTPRTNIALFADDTTIFAESRNIEAIIENLQNHLNILSSWCKNWKISINPLKSASIMFSLRRNRTPSSLNFNNAPIPWKPTVKYLGVTLDKRLTWWPHLSSKIQQAYQRLSRLFPILNRKSTLEKKCSLLIYKQILRPLITYACPIWGNCAPTHLKKLQIFQNKILRIITNAPWFVRNQSIHKDLKIPILQDHIKILANSFFKSIPKSTGSMHYQLNIGPPLQRRLRRGRPHDLLAQINT
ncbi:hypothetical protein QTP88_027450 [Uroleucon formosanum]